MNALIEMPPALPRHPAKYTDALLPVFVEMLDGCTRILDPFGGTGKIFDIAPFLPGASVEAVEIQPLWAAYDSRITLGNALDLPWGDNEFDAVCVSPVYGNRMSDKHNAQDASRRNTYTHAYGEPLEPDNAGRLQWGDAYREFHVRAWTEARRVLKPRGTFVLNIKDHIRAGKRMYVTAWHVHALRSLGFVPLEHRRVDCPGQRHGANGHLRVEYESVIKFRLGAK